MTAIAIARLGFVAGSKALPPEMGAHLAREVRRFFAEKYVDADGTPWSQRRIEEERGGRLRGSATCLP